MFNAFFLLALFQGLRKVGFFGGRRSQCRIVEVASKFVINNY